MFQVDYYKEGDDIFFDIGGNRIPFGNVKVGHVVKFISHERKLNNFDVLNLWGVDVDKSKQEIMEHHFERYFEIDRKLTDNIHIVAAIATTITGKCLTIFVNNIKYAFSLSIIL